MPPHKHPDDDESLGLRAAAPPPPPPPPKQQQDYGTILVENGNGDADVNSPMTPRPTTIHSVQSTASSSRKRTTAVLIKTPTTFCRDAWNFQEGTVPHSMVLALSIGIVCGVAAWIYYAALEWALQFLWQTLPERLFASPSSVPPVLWIPLVGFSMATGLGLTVVFMGEPGDLPYTIQCVHDKAYVAMNHVLPMVVASQFSILGGGSLGPEAPLVAICAALGGFVSRRLYKCQQRNLIRKHTLMGVRCCYCCCYCYFCAD